MNSGELLQQVKITNFRGIEHLVVPLTHESSLPGHWTCVVGINGAGKTTVLQAIALALLGGSFALELKTGFLRRLRRQGARGTTEAQLVVQTENAYWPMTLQDKPPIFVGGMNPASGRAFANYLPPLVVGYGASRNLSEFEDGRWVDASQPVRRVVTLFDPLTRVMSTGALIRGLDDTPGWRLFAKLLEQLPLPLSITSSGGRWLDSPRATPRQLSITISDVALQPISLPDGYRSTLAWLADLCLQHGEQFPDVDDLDQMTGVVLIDEIDLHLHPKLQRELVPSLRKALPRVQWVVTTHSPLVLTCFDRSEIIALDRDAEGGIRELDRQILGWSADDVYRWLMGTPPSGGALPDTPATDPVQREALLRTSPDVDDEQARQKALERRAALEKVLDR